MGGALSDLSPFNRHPKYKGVVGHFTRFIRTVVAAPIVFVISLLKSAALFVGSATLFGVLLLVLSPILVILFYGGLAGIFFAENQTAILSGINSFVNDNQNALNTVIGGLNDALRFISPALQIWDDAWGFIFLAIGELFSLFGCTPGYDCPPLEEFFAAMSAVWNFIESVAVLFYHALLSFIDSDLSPPSVLRPLRWAFMTTFALRRANTTGVLLDGTRAQRIEALRTHWRDAFEIAKCRTTAPLPSDASLAAAAAHGVVHPLYGGLFGSIYDFFEFLFSEAVITALVDFFKFIFDNSIQTVITLFEQFISDFGPAFQWLESNIWTNGLLEGLWGLEQGATAFADFFQNVWVDFLSAYSQFTNYITGYANSIASEFGTLANDFLGLVSIVDGEWDFILNFLSGGGLATTSSVTSGVSSAASSAESAATSVISGLGVRLGGPASAANSGGGWGSSSDSAGAAPKRDAATNTSHRAPSYFPTISPPPRIISSQLPVWQHIESRTVNSTHFPFCNRVLNSFEPYVYSRAQFPHRLVLYFCVVVYHLEIAPPRLFARQQNISAQAAPGSQKIAQTLSRTSNISRTLVATNRSSSSSSTEALTARRPPPMPVMIVSERALAFRAGLERHLQRFHALAETPEYKRLATSWTRFAAEAKDYAARLKLDTDPAMRPFCYDNTTTQQCVLKQQQQQYDEIVAYVRAPLAPDSEARRLARFLSRRPSASEIKAYWLEYRARHPTAPRAKYSVSQFVPSFSVGSFFTNLLDFFTKCDRHLYYCFPMINPNVQISLVNFDINWGCCPPPHQCVGYSSAWDEFTYLMRWLTHDHVIAIDTALGRYVRAITFGFGYQWWVSIFTFPGGVKPADGAFCFWVNIGWLLAGAFVVLVLFLFCAAFIWLVALVVIMVLSMAWAVVTLVFWLLFAVLIEGLAKTRGGTAFFLVMVVLFFLCIAAFVLAIFVLTTGILVCIAMLLGLALGFIAFTSISRRIVIAEEKRERECCSLPAGAKTAIPAATAAGTLYRASYPDDSWRSFFWFTAPPTVIELTPIPARTRTEDDDDEKKK